jgi:DHA3 family tetracycline resistance protein-like MFS transporter
VSEPVVPEVGWRRIGVLRPFAIRDFRLLWFGMSVSLFGDGVFFVALVWQAYELTDSPGKVALIGLAWTGPMVALLLVGGVISDRFDRRLVMIASDVIRACAVAVLGLLAVTGSIELWHLVVLVAAYGAGDALFPGAFNALVPQLVPAEQLVQANSVDQLVRPLMLLMIGPAVGGVVVAAAGAGAAFLLDAGTFAASTLALALMRSRPARQTAAAAAGMLAEIREGFRFVRSEMWIWGTLVCASLFLLVYLGPWDVLVPYVVKNELGATARDLGFVYAASGVGAVLAAAVMAQRRLPRRAITFMYVSFTLEVAMLIVYGVAGAVWHMLIAAFVAGVCIASANVVWMTLLQRRVPGHLLGRVSSLDWLISISLTPISFALIGPIADAVGVQETLVAAGLIGSVITISFLFLPGMRDLERKPAPA